MQVPVPTPIGSYATASTADRRLRITAASLGTVIGMEKLYKICNLYYIAIFFYFIFIYEI